MLLLLGMNWDVDGVLRIEIPRNGRVAEFEALFRELERVFNHLYALDLIIDEAKRAAGESWKQKSVRTLRSVTKPRKKKRVIPRLRA